MVLEDTISEYTDALLNDWQEGKFKNDYQGVTAALKSLDSAIKNRFEYVRDPCLRRG